MILTVSQAASAANVDTVSIYYHINKSKRLHAIKVAGITHVSHEELMNLYPHAKGGVKQKATMEKVTQLDAKDLVDVIARLNATMERVEDLLATIE